MRALLTRLGDPQLALRGVLIAGTNGKGSVAAMTAAMLGAAGYSTGQSPSPHLHSYRERITLDGRPIAVDDLQALLEEVLGASEPGVAEHGPATEFELLTAAAYLWSARRGVDVMVMEVGLGGRLDASNAWGADVAAITNVSLDHQEFLGHTIASVAAEKAAIIRTGQLVVTGAGGEALKVIGLRAAEQQARLTVCPPLPLLAMSDAGITLGHDRLGPLAVSLLGRHQAANAAVALGIIAALREAGVTDVPDDAIRRGLAGTRWPGRLELLQRAGQVVLLDGAHNPDGARSLAIAVDDLGPSLPAGRVTLLLGILADKDVPEVLRELRRSKRLCSARFVASGVPETPRALPAADLARLWAEAPGAAVDAAFDDAGAALEYALDRAASDGGPLIIAGSLYLLGHLRARLVGDAVMDTTTGAMTDEMTDAEMVADV